MVVGLLELVLTNKTDALGVGGFCGGGGAFDGWFPGQGCWGRYTSWCLVFPVSLVGIVLLMGIILLGVLLAQIQWWNLFSDGGDYSFWSLVYLIRWFCGVSFGVLIFTWVWMVNTGGGVFCVLWSYFGACYGDGVRWLCGIAVCRVFCVIMVMFAMETTYIGLFFGGTQFSSVLVWLCVESRTVMVVVYAPGGSAGTCLRCDDTMVAGFFL